MGSLLLVLALASPPSPAAPARAAEIVRSVSIDAPAEQATRLLDYLTVRSGEPLSLPAVRESVELLYATGLFADVVVEQVSVRDGVGIVFHPRPAPLLQAVRVQGDRVLSPSEIRRATRLDPREPLWRKRLDRAARDAAVALTERGYLEARVTAEASPVAAGADAVFRVVAGPRARVKSLAITGLEPRETERLLAGVGPRPGQVFERRRAQDSAEKLRRKLVELGHDRASVEVRTVYDPARSQVALSFDAHPGLLIRVEYSGESVPGALKRRIRALIREGSARADALEEAADRIEESFRLRGYREALVSLREEDTQATHVIHYDVQAGPRSVVASVRIRGEAPADVLDRVTTRPGEPLVDHTLDQDAAALRSALEASGHADPEVEVNAPEGGGMVPVVFEVRAGPVTRVVGFEVALPDGAPRPMSFQELRTRVGLPYRVRDLVLDRNAVLGAYRNAGYLQCEVTPEVHFSADRSEVRAALRVEPGARTEVGHIVIAGLGRTRPAVVRRELEVKEGGPLGIEALLESQRRLSALGIFRRVDVVELDPATVHDRDLLVSLQEAPRTTVAYGLGYSETDQLRASAEVTRRNLGGLDRSVSLFARASFRGSRLLATYREPYFLGHKQDFFVTLFREEDSRDTFDFARYGGLVQTAIRLSSETEGRGGTRLILRYTFQDTQTFDVQVPCGEVDRQFCNSTLSGPSASVVNDTRDDPLDPRGGHFVGADVQFSHEVLGGDSFVKGFFQASVYRRLAPRLVLATNARLGLARTLGLGQPLRLPLPERFFAGGDYSLRGFKVDSVEPEGGNALLLGGAELRFDLGHHVSLATFSDIGNVFPLVSQIDLGRLRYTAGLGLRYRSAFGPLRVDWGYKLNRRPGESPSRFHFTIGHAF